MPSCGASINGLWLCADIDRQKVERLSHKHARPIRETKECECLFIIYILACFRDLAMVAYRGRLTDNMSDMHEQEKMNKPPLGGDKAQSDKPNDGKPRGARVSDRRFKRYNRARERQLASAKADDAFFKAVFSLAGVTTGVVFILAWVMMNGGGGLAALAPLTEPWLGPFSQLEIIGFGVIALLAAIYFLRVRKK